MVIGYCPSQVPCAFEDAAKEDFQILTHDPHPMYRARSLHRNPFRIPSTTHSVSPARQTKTSIAHPVCLTRQLSRYIAFLLHKLHVYVATFMICLLSPTWPHFLQDNVPHIYCLL
ncbi:hypothetical protein CC78DRAFT_536223, partial [Lojkania enalia]